MGSDWLPPSYQRHLEEVAATKAREHLEAIFDAEYDNVVGPETAPFCGCVTCLVREVLWAAQNEIWAHVEADLKDLVDDVVLSRLTPGLN